MVDDIKSFIARLKAHGIDASPPEDQGWGVLTTVPLPGGSKVSVYEPRHPSPRRAVTTQVTDAAEPKPKSRGAAKPDAKAAAAGVVAQPKARRGRAAAAAAASQTGPKARKTAAKK